LRIKSNYLEDDLSKLERATAYRGHLDSTDELRINMSAITSINRSCFIQITVPSSLSNLLPSLSRVKQIAKEFFEGCIVGFFALITVSSLAFIAGIGFGCGQQKVAEAFGRVSALRS